MKSKPKGQGEKKATKKTNKRSTREGVGSPGKDMPMPEKSKQVKMRVQNPSIGEIVIPIIGTTTLIQNPLTMKSKENLPGSRARWDKKHGKGANRTEEKAYLSPDDEYTTRLDHYRLADGSHGHPVSGFKKAILRMVKQLKETTKLTMVDVACLLWIVADDGDLVKIEGTHRHRNDGEGDVVKVDNKACVHHRPEFLIGWRVKLRIQFLENFISAQDITNIVQMAGFVGVGEWRAEKGGDHGKWTIEAR